PRTGSASAVPRRGDVAVPVGVDDDPDRLLVAVHLRPVHHDTGRGQLVLPEHHDVIGLREGHAVAGPAALVLADADDDADLTDMFRETRLFTDAYLLEVPHGSITCGLCDRRATRWRASRPGSTCRAAPCPCR